MPAPTVAQSGFGAILLAVQTQLATKTGFPTQRIRLVKDWPPVDSQPLGDQDLSLRPLGFVNRSLDGDNGAGRLETIVHRQLAVLLRTRLEVDVDEDATSWWTDKTLGHLALEEAVLDAVHGFYPSDKNQNLLTTEQIHFTTENLDQVPPWPGRGGTILVFEVSYLPPINTAIL